MAAFNGNGNTSNLLKAFIVSQGLALLGVIAWLLVLSFNIGERARQIDVDTNRINIIEANGSSGLRDTLAEVNRRLDRIEEKLDRADRR